MTMMTLPMLNTSIPKATWGAVCGGVNGWCKTKHERDSPIGHEAPATTTAETHEKDKLLLPHAILRMLNVGDHFLGAEDAGAMIQRRTPKSSCQQMLIDVVGVSLVYRCDRLVNLEENGPNGWEVQNHSECVLCTDKR